jgi:hypothetical protein
VLAPAARLPDPLVRPVPVVAHPLDDPDDVLPGLVGDGRPVLVVEVDGVDQLAVDVELELMSGPVADPDGRGPPVSLEMVERLLRQLRAAVDAVHDLKRPAIVDASVPEAIGEPAHERLRLLREAEP